MKKISLFIFVLILLVLFAGCAAGAPALPEATPDNIKVEADESEEAQGETVDVGSSLILVRSDGVLTEPYKNFLWAMSCLGNDWVSADGMSIVDKFPEVHEEIPQITCSDDFEIYYGDGVTFSYISVYDENFGELHHDTGESVLKNLREGTYYLVVAVQSQGRYIEPQDKYESSGYQCVYKLVVPEDMSG